MKKYMTYNKYLIRKPLFSYQILFNNDETKNIEDVVEELIQDDSFVTSIYWSSPDLYDTIISYREKILKEDKIPRLIHTLKKYVIRASTRCTPYGTMAGIALQDFKNSHKPEPISRKARIDMDFLADLKFHIENNENIRKKLRYNINNTLDKIPGQYRYQEPVRNDNDEKYQLSSLEMNEYLHQFSEISSPMKYDEIKKLLSEDFEDDEISDFIDKLIDIKFLVSELQLTLTSDNTENIKTILHELLDEEISEAGFYLKILNKIEQCVSIIEETSLSHLPITEISEIKRLVNTLGIDKTHFFHVDLKHSSESTFNMDEKTLRNINTAVSILHQFRSGNSIQNDLEAFKKNFNTKYDLREIPLTEVLDSEFGINFPAGSQIGNFQGSSLIEGFAREKNSQKKHPNISNLDVLLDLIEKDKKEVIYLENIGLKINEVPVKTQNFCVVGSPVDNHFFLQNIGTSGANSILGRFALLDEKIKDFCNEIHKKEQENSPKIIFAEIIYIPEKRTANITRRPKFLNYEIPIFANSSDNDMQILLKDIMISVKDNEIILRSKKLNKRIIPRLSNAHNFYKSESAAYKFLCAVQAQNQDNINLNINYSKIKKRFFPRIVYRNIILHRACWVMHENDIYAVKMSKNPLSTLKDFFQKWNVSKYIVLVQGDNELFLDITNDSYLLLLIDELKNNTLLQLSEWLQPINGEKNYNQQIVLPLENKEVKSQNSWSQHKETSIQRSFAPGSEWLYLKIYCNSNISDSLLSGLKPILDELIYENYIKNTFFIRYTDPHYHIRLRLHLTDQNLYSEVLQKLHENLNPYFQEETIWNLQIDSYQREIERYQPEFMEATEEAFYHDSVLILNLLDQETFAENENIRLFAAVKNVNSWLSLFELSLQEKLDFCKSMENVFLKEFAPELKSHINSKYRMLKEDLYLFFIGNEFGDEFHERNQHIRNIKLCKEALSSYIHMSINRWFSSEQRALELMTYSFAAKYYNRILSQSK
ncbi:lantibiotic dehydratase [Chryseobacterium sp. LC2016-29]|uniref:lantibiotic dehydratase n=1 Tax=Chryseobacterium sp. LC2016-29 TaxID=2897331 RepID=UPI001E3D0628|nr:lantibiotic dehydratase [Chryseobacterium sp. LC2016-29]MCD0480694.1 lantibiotic dehydratase [Chryseobacterium sp. LC2016-29]